MRTKLKLARTSLLLFLLTVISSVSSAFQVVRPARLCKSHLYAASASAEYVWELASDDGVLISDLLLEMGAQSTEVVLSEEGASLDARFHVTGKVQASSSTVLFSTLDDASAQQLVEGVSDIMDLDATAAWRACRKQDIVQNDSFQEAAAEQPKESYTVQVGDNTLVLANRQGETCWAFGDGNHPSTRVNLAALESYVTRNSSVLDFGCGTGILGVGARALGASEVTAVDISREALELTRLNFQRNSQSDDHDDGIKILHADDFVPSRKRFDLVVANIPANTLVALLGTLAESMREDGVLLLSGYPTNEAQVVSTVASEKHGLHVVHQSYDSGWVLQILRSNPR
jgi:ribosomal protein L11 methylase PrmA